MEITSRDKDSRRAGKRFFSAIQIGCFTQNEMPRKKNNQGEICGWQNPILIIDTVLKVSC
jgi:hypothetical protein